LTPGSFSLLTVTRLQPVYKLASVPLPLSLH